MPACTACHMERPAGGGRHAVTGKDIKPLAPAANTERLTDRARVEKWFRREHDEVPAAAWSDQQIRSPANCAACHTRAVAGSFSEHELSLPGGRRHERD